MNQHSLSISTRQSTKKWKPLEYGKPRDAADNSMVPFHGHAGATKREGQYGRFSRSSQDGIYPSYLNRPGGNGGLPMLNSLKSCLFYLTTYYFLSHWEGWGEGIHEPAYMGKNVCLSHTAVFRSRTGLAAYLFSLLGFGPSSLYTNLRPHLIYYWNC